ncbi:MAG TPA: glucose-6-phosphate isomerase [Actinomycetota bacterium]
MNAPETATLGPLAEPVRARIAAMARDRTVERIWERDHTVWRDDPTEIADRLGWLDVAGVLRPRLDELTRFGRQAAAGGFTGAVLLGMGGSSLAPETMRRTLGVAAGAIDVRVLDSTHPDAVRRIEREMDLRRTLFVVASKSGSTIETLSHLQYFYGRVQRGTHFVAITDPGSPLEALAGKHEFAGLFLNPDDIGGRFSALSLFGLVPAALIGADLDALAAGALAMAARCRAPAGDNPGALLGAALGEAALSGRDKASFVYPDALAPLGAWVEQLVAESTGKDGRGILPVAGEPAGDAAVFGDDRIFVDTGGHDWVAASGAPRLVIESGGASPAETLGAEFFRLEFATAVAGHVLGIHPFDQPDVASAKQATSEILDAGGAAVPSFEDPAAVLDPAPAYCAILAFVDPSDQNAARLERIRTAIRDRLRIAVTTGFGPRYLHSTGQVHKGGPPGGGFLVVTDEAHPDDVGIPGRGFTFGTLIDAQAEGDLRALRAAGRRVARVRMQDLEAFA